VTIKGCHVVTGNTIKTLAQRKLEASYI